MVEVLNVTYIPLTPLAFNEKMKLINIRFPEGNISQLLLLIVSIGNVSFFVSTQENGVPS